MQTILVVEDDSFLRALLEEVLVEEGYRVCIAADGEQAISTIAEEVPDLVLADVRLPFGIVQTVRWCLEFFFQSIPLVVMSGSPLPPDLEGRPFLRKPFDLDDLLTIVATSLSSWPHDDHREGSSRSVVGASSGS